MNNSGDHTKCNVELWEKVMQSTDTEELMSKFSSIITAACDAAFKVSRAGDQNTKGRSGPVNSWLFENERSPLEDGT